MSKDLPILSEGAVGDNPPGVPRAALEDGGAPAAFDPAGGSLDGYAPEPEEESGLNWRRYFAALLRYKWLIAVCTVLGGAGGRRGH